MTELIFALKSSVNWPGTRNSGSGLQKDSGWWGSGSGAEARKGIPRGRWVRWERGSAGPWSGMKNSF
jgi:hypothetical protein